MVVNLSDINHLNVMANLEEREVPAKSTEIQVPIVDKSLANNLFKLTNALRTKGFIRYAELLEDKFLTYKTAKTHLYRAHDEDGEDLINAAHPDKDPNMGDGDLGDVENILTRHKKIVDIVNKQPHGKLANYVKQCKIVLAEHLSDEEISFFLEIADDVLSTINYAIIKPLSTNKYLNVDLSGTSVGKHLDFIKSSIDEVNSSKEYIRGFDKKIQDSSKNKVNNLLQYCIKFITSIRDDAEKNPVSQFDLKYAPHVLSLLTNLQHRWFVYWNKYVVKDESAAQWHDQFLSADVINRTSSLYIHKYNALSTFLKNALLANDIIESHKDIKDYLEYLVSYLTAGVLSLTKLVSEITAFENKSGYSLSDKKSEITIDLVKKIIANIQSGGDDATKDYCADLNVESLDNFKQSASNIASNVSNNIIKLFNERSEVSEIKEAVISRIPR